MSWTVIKRATWLAFMAAMYAYGFVQLPEGGPAPLEAKIKLMWPWLGQAWPAIALMTMATAGAVWSVATIVAERRGRSLEGDWHMAELVRYLRYGSEWSGNFKTMTEWSHATRQAREDHLGSGRLACWGRSSLERGGAIHPPPRRLEDTKIWTGLTLDLTSILVMNRDHAETHPIWLYEKDGSRRQVTYYDLHVNKHQARQRWKPTYGPARLLYVWRLSDPMFDGFTKTFLVRSWVRTKRENALQRLMRIGKRSRFAWRRTPAWLKRKLLSISERLRRKTKWISS